MLPVAIPFQADQTKLVRALLARSKDIGCDTPIVSPDQFDTVSRQLSRCKYRWMWLDSVQHAGLLADARARHADAVSEENTKRVARCQKIIDDLEMAEMVNKVSLAEEVSWHLLQEGCDESWLKGLQMEDIPHIVTEEGAWAAWHSTMQAAYERISKFVREGCPLGPILLTVKVTVDDIKQRRPGEKAEWYAQYFSGLHAHLPMAVETEVTSFIEYTLQHIAKGE